MKFGKLPSVDTVDFNFLDTSESTKQVLEKYPNPERQYFYIGCTGWSMKEWIGSVYPSKTKAKDFLKAYGKQFNTIELNTTHYRIPTLQTIEKWRQETPSDFRFCPKIPQIISHRKDLGISGDNIQRFCDVIARLEERLGCCFLQLPPYFATDRLPLLQQFIEQFPTSSIPLAIELRHESWFKEKEYFEALMSLCEATKVSTVITDVAGRRDVLHLRLATNSVLVRFVGNALHPTDYTRIDDWIKQLKIWFAQGLQAVYFFPHEPDNLLAPELAAYLLQQVEKELNVIVRGPNFIKEQKQMSLF